MILGKDKTVSLKHEKYLNIYIILIYFPVIIRKELRNDNSRTNQELSRSPEN